MCSLCRLPVAKNHNFWQILTFGGSCTDPLLPMRVKFGVLQLYAKFHPNVFIALATGGQKPQFLANFDIWGLLYRPSFTDEGQIWCAIADPRHTLASKFRLDRFILSPSVGEKSQFLPFFWTSAYSGVSNWQQSEKLNTGAQLQTFPYQTASKSFLYSNGVTAKSGAQSLTFKSLTNTQTNKHGMVIEDLQHVLAPLKLLGI